MAPGPAGPPSGVACLECGARDLQASRPGWLEGLGEWLRLGGRWRPARWVCRRCGATSDARAHAELRAPRPGWWWVPVRLVQTLRHHRAMVPAPAVYLAAAAAGAGLGAAAQVALGWSWWLVAAAVVAAVWLGFAATALSGPGESLATDLLRVVDPGRAVERDRRQEAERFRAAAFPLYGLPPAWPGPRYLGGWEGGWSRGARPVTTALSLGHGDPRGDQGPQLQVETRAEPVDTGAVLTLRLLDRRQLAEELWLAAAPPAGTLAEHVEQVAAIRRRPDPAWSQVAIPVDGRPVAFAWLAEGRHWVAVADLEDRTLVLRGRDLPVESVALVRVADPEPYIEGSRRLRAGAGRGPAPRP